MPDPRGEADAKSGSTPGLCRPVDRVRSLLFSPAYIPHVATVLLLGEAALNALIIQRVSYTEIDWRAYMQEVAGVLHGELDYTKLAGDTGPLVYPAGFVHFYAALYRLTGRGADVRLAQYVFAGIYLLSLAIVFAIYHRTKAVPPYALVFLTLSKRLHSIYVLRLFNDGVAMLALYASVYALTRRMWSLAGVLFSAALSVKMNILLFSPAYGLILFKCVGLVGALNNFVVILAVQVMLGHPFLSTYPQEYLSRAFEFSRAFKYEWTVNWRFLPERAFLSPAFASALLVGHVTVLGCFLFGRWCGGGGRDGGPVELLRKGLSTPFAPPSVASGALSASGMVTMLFTSNLIGVVFARSLHYQFYSWYAHQTVFLAWQTRYPLLVRVALLLAIEYAWNVYPSTDVSSAVLLCANVALLTGVYFSCRIS